MAAKFLLPYIHTGGMHLYIQPCPPIKTHGYQFFVLKIYAKFLWTLYFDQRVFFFNLILIIQTNEQEAQEEFNLWRSDNK